MGTFVVILVIVNIIFLLGTALIDHGIRGEIKSLQYTRGKQAESIEALRRDLSRLREVIYDEPTYSPGYFASHGGLARLKLVTRKEYHDLAASLDSLVDTLGYVKAYESAKEYYKKVKKEKKS